MYFSFHIIDSIYFKFYNMIDCLFTFRMNFMIIRHDLKISRKKECLSFFAHFWGRLPFDPKIFAKKCPFKLKNWLLRCFCMGNPKKIVSGRFVDPNDELNQERKYWKNPKSPRAVPSFFGPGRKKSPWPGPRPTL